MKRYRLFKYFYYFKLLLRIFAYCFFLYYCFFISKSLYMQILSLVVIIFSLWIETVKYLYHKTIYSLNYELNPIKSDQYYQKLIKIDFLHTISNELLSYHCFKNLVLFNLEEVIETIRQNPLVFKSSKNQLYLSNGLLLLTYAYQDSPSKVISTFKEIEKLKHVKDILRIYNEPFFEIIYSFYNNNPKQAIKNLEILNTTHMNLRELCEYHFFAIKFHKQLNNIESAKKHLETLKILDTHSIYLSKINI